VPPQIQTLLILISATKQDFPDNTVPLEPSHGTASFYKQANATNAASLLDQHLHQFHIWYFVHQGHITQIMTAGLLWTKKAKPEDFTNFANSILSVLQTKDTE
jgi:hypothetical protein